MNNSFFYSFVDDDRSSRSGKRTILVKHGESRDGSRPGSLKKVKVPELLEKKVENLEKKQEMWKEREQVWGKEKKNLQKALKNVRKIQAFKDPAEYYKNLLNNWHAAQKGIKQKNESFYEDIEKVRGFFTWVLDQNGETPLKYIQKLTEDQLGYLEEIEKEFKKKQSKSEAESNKVIESLRRENEQLTEKMTSGMQDVISCLQLKIQELSNDLIAKGKELEAERAENLKLEEQLSKTQKKVDFKEKEVVEYKQNIEVLEEQIDCLKETIEAKKAISRLPLHEIAENSQMVLEKYLIQLKELEEENVRIKRMNEVYKYEIENMQKFKSSGKQGKKLDAFDVKIASTQTGQNEGFSDVDFLQILNCMSVGLEECLLKSSYNDLY